MPDKIRKVLFKEGTPYEMELVQIKSIIASQKNLSSTPNRTSFYHIFWFSKGTPRHIVDFIPIDIKPNTLLFINKDRVHTFDHSADYDGHILVFTERFFAVQKQI